MSGSIVTRLRTSPPDWEYGWDIDKVPEHLLPYYAEQFFADTWHPELSLDYQRRAIKSSWFFWQTRGTRFALNQFFGNLQIPYGFTVIRDYTSDAALLIAPVPLINVQFVISDSPVIPPGVDRVAIDRWMQETVCRLLTWDINDCQIHTGDTYTSVVATVMIMASAEYVDLRDEV